MFSYLIDCFFLNNFFENIHFQNFVEGEGEVTAFVLHEVLFRILDLDSEFEWDWKYRTDQALTQIQRINGFLKKEFCAIFKRPKGCWLLENNAATIICLFFIYI